MVIPAIDYIDETFTTGMLSNTVLNPAIKAAIKQAKKTLNRYYEWTDASSLYCIAMGIRSICIHWTVQLLTHPSIVLHLHYKLEYFKLAGWEEEWITTACKLTQDVFNMSYAMQHVPREPSNE